MITCPPHQWTEHGLTRNGVKRWRCECGKLASGNTGPVEAMSWMLHVTMPVFRLKEKRALVELEECSEFGCDGCPTLIPCRHWWDTRIAT